MSILITSLLLASSISAVSAGDLVEVWGIARCPDTSKFVNNQLLPFYKSFSPLPENLTLHFHSVPTSGSLVDGEYVNKCLHGPVECGLNKLQMCAKKYIEKDSLLTVGCIQGKKTIEQGVSCLPKGKLGENIEKCSKSQEGELLLNDENSYRFNVAPTSSWLPWIQINGERVVEAEKDLKKYICALESMKEAKQCKKN